MMRFFQRISFAALTMLLAGATNAAAGPLLLQHPTLSRTQIAFDYAGEIWTVDRSGGRAQPIVVGRGQNSHPIFSPDGQFIAFTGRYDGNTDVYVVPAAGGETKRLTWHPGDDEAVAWSPDGGSILFRSLRNTPRDLEQLYAINVHGGPATPLPLPSGFEASYSPDAAQLAYTPFSQWQPAWKHYRGGQTARIWIADLKNSEVVEVPRTNSNDRNPIWVGGLIYFLSDRDGPITLYAYDPKSKAVRSVVPNKAGFDIASASAGPGGIVFDQFGALRIFDLATGSVTTVPVTISADLPQVRPHFETLKPKQILSAAITPTGKRVLIEAHGEILSAPAEKGDIRNLTQSPDVADRDPAPSPDGKAVAYFSDESGEYALHIRSADGLGPVRKISLGQPGSFFYKPRWSPDDRKIAFYDKRLILWVVDLEKNTPPLRVDQDLFDSPAFDPQQAWSADSQWLVYVKQLPNHLHAAFVYSVKTGRSTRVTDGLSDVQFPRFDKSGDYLFFSASTSTGLGAGWLDMSSLGRPQDASIYALVLRKDLPSPVGPESDEEALKDDGSAQHAGAVKPTPSEKTKAAANARKSFGEDEEPTKPVSIDFADLDQRIVALPIPAANFAGLATGKAGVVFTLTRPTARADDQVTGEDSQPSETVFRFDLKSRKNVKIAEGLDADSFDLSFDGSKILFARKGAWSIASAEPSSKESASAGADITTPGRPGSAFAIADDTAAKDGKLDLGDLTVWVDPRAEWRQMYREAWRIERDFLYDPKLQGVNYDVATRVYAGYLDGIASRHDLNVLFEEMTGQIGVGHTFVRGGDSPDQGESSVKVGLLGADFEPVGGRYRITRILRGENWNPKLMAPLSQPGVNVHEGEFLLAVNGREVTTESEVYRRFEGLGGKQTTLTVGPRADGVGARQVTVVPVESEAALRLRTWMEDNRRKVDQLSGGQLAYVYLPDTANGGFANFNRYYFAQVGKKGAVIDERFNHGGDIADFIVDQLKRTPQMINATREGAETVEPAEAIFGPKVMIINQMSGSGGDALPWLFKENHVGPLVGVRTWGGLVGIGGYPPLIDGGTITAPRWAIYGTRGQWEVENIGIAPDIEVQQDPAAVRRGGDPQLERAVRTALELLHKTPPATFDRPPYPDRQPIIPGSPR